LKIFEGTRELEEAVIRCWHGQVHTEKTHHEAQHHGGSHRHLTNAQWKLRCHSLHLPTALLSLSHLHKLLFLSFGERERKWVPLNRFACFWVTSFPLRLLFVFFFFLLLFAFSLSLSYGEKE
jgi:hypothetical protein